MASVQAKPVASFVLQNPDHCINKSDWNAFSPLLGMNLSPVVFTHPKASDFNLNVTVHGQVGPSDIENVKTITLDADYFKQGNTKAGISYSIKGKASRIFNTYTGQPEYVCDINVELPISPVMKNLVYILNDQPELLNSEWTIQMDVPQVLAATLAYDIQELCVVGYWADFLGEDISTFEELKNNEAFIEYVKQSIREQLLRERPDLRDLPDLLEEEVEKLYEQMKVKNNQHILS